MGDIRFRARTKEKRSSDTGDDAISIPSVTTASVTAIATLIGTLATGIGGYLNTTLSRMVDHNIPDKQAQLLVIQNAMQFEDHADRVSYLKLCKTLKIIDVAVDEKQVPAGKFNGAILPPPSISPSANPTTPATPNSKPDPSGGASPKTPIKPKAPQPGRQGGPG